MSKQLDFFDCDCFFGRRSVVNPGSFYRLEDLLEKMSFYSIGRALVYHSMACEYNPAVGNEMLLKEIEGNKSLYPVWVVMPHHTGEFPEPDELLTQLKEFNIRAVRVFPGNNDHAYSIAGWNCGELFDMLEENRIPLMLGKEQISWDDLYSLCSNHNKMPVILSGVGYGSDRNLYGLLKKCNNLYIETIGYKPHNGIEEICRVFGANRLIFGSGMPLYSGASAVAMINYARISEEEKRMISSGNLEKLLQYPEMQHVI